MQTKILAMQILAETAASHYITHDMSYTKTQNSDS